MSRKAYKKTRRNQLNIRLKRCEESFRKLKRISKAERKLVLNPRIMNEEVERHRDKIKHFGIVI